jgi:hypothetical protein
MDDNINTLTIVAMTSCILTLFFSDIEFYQSKHERGGETMIPPVRVIAKNQFR